MNCKSCKFAAPATGYQVHECRRNAPIVNKVPAHHDLRQHVPVWPIMHSDDWCGEYQLKEPTNV